MNLKKAIGREKSLKAEDLNIMPVMNLFLILVPFLLLTAVFVKISIIEFSLPGADAVQNKQQAGKPVVTFLTITEKGFDLKSRNFKTPFIKKEGEAFDFEILTQNLQAVKQLHQTSEDIIIAPVSSIKYEIIIQVMDRCRENGFPNISISG